jgi:hypothetical protein
LTPGKSRVLSLTKDGLGHLLGDFSTNSSGHPAVFSVKINVAVRHFTTLSSVQIGTWTNYFAWTILTKTLGGPDPPVELLSVTIDSETMLSCSVKWQ